MEDFRDRYAELVKKIRPFYSTMLEYEDFFINKKNSYESQEV
jgi:hypothetical protein